MSRFHLYCFLMTVASALSALPSPMWTISNEHTPKLHTHSHARNVLTVDTNKSAGGGEGRSEGDEAHEGRQQRQEWHEDQRIACKHLNNSLNTQLNRLICDGTLSFTTWVTSRNDFYSRSGSLGGKMIVRHTATSSSCFLSVHKIFSLFLHLHITGLSLCSDRLL